MDGNCSGGRWLDAILFFPDFFPAAAGICDGAEERIQPSRHVRAASRAPRTGTLGIREVWRASLRTLKKTEPDGC
jgi:hypothetical protein